MNNIRRGDEIIYITHFPDLKKPVLAIGESNWIKIVASFKSEDDAEVFSKWLNRWLGIEKEKE